MQKCFFYLFFVHSKHRHQTFSSTLRNVLIRDRYTYRQAKEIFFLLMKETSICLNHNLLWLLLLWLLLLLHSVALSMVFTVNILKSRRVSILRNAKAPFAQLKGNVGQTAANVMLNLSSSYSDSACVRDQSDVFFQPSGMERFFPPSSPNLGEIPWSIA